MKKSKDGWIKTPRVAAKLPLGDESGDHGWTFGRDPPSQILPAMHVPGISPIEQFCRGLVLYGTPGVTSRFFNVIRPGSRNVSICCSFLV